MGVLKVVSLLFLCSFGFMGNSEQYDTMRTGFGYGFIVIRYNSLSAFSF